MSSNELRRSTQCDSGARNPSQEEFEDEGPAREISSTTRRLTIAKRITHVHPDGRSPVAQRSSGSTPRSWVQALCLYLFSLEPPSLPRPLHFFPLVGQSRLLRSIEANPSGWDNLKVTSLTTSGTKLGGILLQQKHGYQGL